MFVPRNARGGLWIGQPQFEAEAVKGFFCCGGFDLRFVDDVVKVQFTPMGKLAGLCSKLNLIHGIKNKRAFVEQNSPALSAIPKDYV